LDRVSGDRLSAPVVQRLSAPQISPGRKSGYNRRLGERVEGRVRRLVGWGAVALAGVALSGPAGASSAPELITARLSASPSSFSGRCPAEILFTGTITAPRPGKVTYRFIRSDGGAEDPVELVFPKADTAAVGMTWQVGGPGADFKDYRGWLTLEILEPIHLQATPATFRLRCSKRSSSRPPTPLVP
jgi:hypothetical protein